ncbi:Fe2+-dicitrate sensor, membrane component [plant metagenome]|uniref:Fe2+-dicitrate sensor, membrane component n=1 Tax=plant metagenome TaxID=1297885 RepID=A0A484R6M0_9ZZZZ
MTDAADVSAAKDEDPLATRAAQWLVLLTDDDGDARAQAQRGYEAWKREDPRHAAAAADMERMLGRLDGVRRDASRSAARAALQASDAAFHKRRRARRGIVALGLALALCLPAWLALQAWPVGYLMADLRSPAGQWRTQTLPDGTAVTLNSGSAVNVRFDAERRSLELVQGELLVDVAKDAQRPFLVSTVHGTIRALGTRFVVSRHAEFTELSMIESRAGVQTAAQREAGSLPELEVAQGQRVRIGADGLGPVESIDAGSLSDAWRHHQLVVSDRPLAAVLEELARHHRGSLRYAAGDLVGRRVSAVLPLDDTRQALRLLQAQFPELRVRTLSPWLVWVDRQPAGEP